MCLPIFIWGQEKSTERDTLNKFDVTAPMFTGIENVNMLFDENQREDINDYLTKHINYPEEAARCYKQGTAVVQFVVTANGELTDFKMINSVCPVIDQELIRVLETTSGMWKFGLKDEKPADMEQEVSMMFVANPENKTAPYEYFTKLARNHFVKANDLFLEKHNYRKALKSYDQTIKYLPYDASTLLVRGLCKYEMGDREGALSDWERINKIGSFDADWFIENLSYFPGYEEMIAIINK